jgi:hypothetical protein
MCITSLSLSLYPKQPPPAHTCETSDSSPSFELSSTRLTGTAPLWVGFLDCYDQAGRADKSDDMFSDSMDLSTVSACQKRDRFKN